MALSTGSGLAWPSLLTAHSESGLRPSSIPWSLTTGTGFSRCTGKPAHRCRLDIPLLFETGGDAICDFVILCSAPDGIQRERALARNGMTEAKLDAILASQMPLAEKRARANAEIDTGLGLDKAKEMLDSILDGPVRQLRQETD